MDLASIVLADPRILLLDEPTAGIAQREAEASIPLLRRLQQVTNTTVVIVEHDVPLIFALCSQVVVLETGGWYRSVRRTRCDGIRGRWQRILVPAKRLSLFRGRPHRHSSGEMKGRPDDRYRMVTS